MTLTLSIVSAGPSVTVQDMGRTGFLAAGLARGGAADRLALLEAAALLAQATPQAALEMAGFGGRFRFSAPTRIALTGAPMRATLEGAPLRWNASHLIPEGVTLEIGPAEAGIYGYLGVAGGIVTPPQLGARATQASAGIGHRLRAGDTLPVGDDPAPETPLLTLPEAHRFKGGTLRVIEGPQSGYFSADTRARFFATAFPAQAGNRQGLTLGCEAPFAIETGGSILSEPITAGDIQMTGAGVPAILLAECQTIGGYPRIGTAIPADLPLAAQTPQGATLRFRPVTLAEAEAACPSETRQLETLRAAVTPLRRTGFDTYALLGGQLIGGAIRGDEEEPWRAGST